MGPQSACLNRGKVTLVAFVWLFSTVCFQMSPQNVCPRRCIVTLVAFVQLFSSVCFQMSPQMTCPRRCVFTLVAFFQLYSIVCLFQNNFHICILRHNCLFVTIPQYKLCRALPNTCSKLRKFKIFKEFLDQEDKDWKGKWKSLEQEQWHVPLKG